jgi:signal transduction histidine kinase
MLHSTPARLRLLQVEDSEDDADLIRFELERVGFVLDARRVDSEAAFIDALETDKWDVVISDFHMPAFDGLRAYTIYRARGFDSPFIFVSGALGETLALEAMRAGVRDFVPKGNLARLPLVVRRELEAAEAARRHRHASMSAERERLRLAAAVEATGAGIFEHAVPVEDELFISNRCLEILGESALPLEAPGDTVARLLAWVHPEDLGRVESRYLDVLQGRSGRFEVACRIRRHDGSWAHITSYAKALQGADGKTNRIVGAVLDDSPRSMLENQLRQAQKMEAIGQLAGGIAHDFNNILTAILGFAQLGSRRVDADHPARPDFDHIMRAGRRAEKLTAQLLAFSRRREVQPRTVDLNVTIEEVRPMLETLIGEDVEFRVITDPELWPATIDPSALEQVIVNLAVNARDAMPEGGTLTIETRNVTVPKARDVDSDSCPRAGEHATLSVSDTGTGMDPETQARIFEPFFTTKQVGKGTGLGLSTCYGIVRQAGGQLNVESRLGVGTRFTVYLARADQPAHDRPAHVEGPDSLHGTETVLVAEDDPQVRELVVYTLRTHGYQVLEADGPEAAMTLAAALDTPADLLISDVIMPGCSGPRLAEGLRQHWPGLRVLYMSGYTANAIAERGGLPATTRILHKPFAAVGLLSEVRRALDDVPAGTTRSPPP